MGYDPDLWHVCFVWYFNVKDYLVRYVFRSLKAIPMDNEDSFINKISILFHMATDASTQLHPKVTINGKRLFAICFVKLVNERHFPFIIKSTSEDICLLDALNEPV